MKKLVNTFLLTIFYGLAIGQDRDYNARQYYAEAEANYLNNLFPEAIHFCDQAAQELGSTNQKILYLELEAYSSLLHLNCRHALFLDIGRINRYINLYLDSLSTGVENEKRNAILMFKQRWNDFEKNGYHIFTYKDLNLGFIFTVPVKFNDANWMEISKVEKGGVFENLVGHDALYPDRVYPPFEEGFLVGFMHIYAFYSDGTNSYKERGIMLYNTPGIDGFLRALNNKNCNIIKYEVIIGGINPKEKKGNEIDYEVSIPCSYF